MVLYDSPVSGNCYKVRLLLSHLGIEFERRWVDVPAKYHNNACGFSFADGHSEIHKWIRAGAIPAVTYVGLSSVINTPSNPDVLWIATRTSAYINGASLPY